MTPALADPFVPPTRSTSCRPPPGDRSGPGGAGLTKGDRHARSTAASRTVEARDATVRPMTTRTVVAAPDRPVGARYARGERRRVISRLPVDLRDELYAAAAASGLSVNDTVISLLDAGLARAKEATPVTP